MQSYLFRNMDQNVKINDKNKFISFAPIYSVF